MITLEQCARLAGVGADQLRVGISPTERHQALLSSYLLNLHHGDIEVKKMILRDIFSFIDLGARDYAADLLIVLRLFVSGDYGDA